MERQVEPSTGHQQYWRRTLRLTASVIAIWFVVTFVVGYFARDLSFNFFGWPFSFYMGAQGAPIVYCLLIAWYGHRMNRLDREFDVAEPEPE